MYNDYLESPLGLIEFKASDKGITQLIFCGEQTSDVKANELTRECQAQLKDYFAGELTQFFLPLDIRGTEFQKKVWQLLKQVAYGKTISYMDIANRLNNPKAVRAVGGANGRNPITLILPCHRVIGANGKLTGYAGGTARKKWLLQHEGVNLKQEKTSQSLTDVIHQRQDKTQFLQ
ncbi:methylated-DNA--[protein]-cysteine S-methyltransferase [Catenovulum sp. SM1970]|uniref:methylated-DNA--[protein]-cysteine S-methyltransferase n=1 Tax=Marinifaba aquimaris TaxID=2741323 RepID=UPI0015742C2A|nr:methylated-DNA--[protein]-cysteine S-methyltransferase [Marinifaba aquimaris]NTS76642.1 methylated-DNA--[protein]-cysteine S-methyltransferase [Marinifaba aquimaris]